MKKSLWLNLTVIATACLLSSIVYAESQDTRIAAGTYNDSKKLFFLHHPNQGAQWEYGKLISPLSSKETIVPSSASCANNLCVIGGLFSTEELTPGVPMIVFSKDKGVSWEELHLDAEGLQPNDFAQYPHYTLPRISCNSTKCVIRIAYQKHPNIKAPSFPYFISSSDQGKSWSLDKSMNTFLDDTDTTRNQTISCNDSLCLSTGLLENNMESKKISKPYIATRSAEAKGWTYHFDVFENKSAYEIFGKCQNDMCVVVGSPRTGSDQYRTLNVAVTVDKGNTWSIQKPVPIKNINMFMPDGVTYSGDTWIVTGYGYDKNNDAKPFAMTGNYVIDKSTGKGTMEWEESTGLDEGRYGLTSPAVCNTHFCVMSADNMLVISKDHGKSWFFKAMPWLGMRYYDRDAICNSNVCTLAGVTPGSGANSLLVILESSDGDHWTSSSISKPPHDVDNGDLYVIGGSESLSTHHSKKFGAKKELEHLLQKGN